MNQIIMILNLFQRFVTQIGDRCPENILSERDTSVLKIEPARNVAMLAARLITGPSPQSTQWLSELNSSEWERQHTDFIPPAQFSTAWMFAYSPLVPVFHSESAGGRTFSRY